MCINLNFLCRKPRDCCHYIKLQCVKILSFSWHGISSIKVDPGGGGGGEGKSIISPSPPIFKLLV